MGTLRKISNLFIIDEVISEQIAESITKENRKCMMVFSPIAFIFFFLLTFLSLIDSSIHHYFPVYSSYAALSLVYIALTHLIHQTKYMRLLVYSFMFFIISFGIVLGAVFSPNELTVSYIALIFAVPLLFTGRPITTNSMVLLSILIYTGIACFTEDRHMLYYNLVDVFCYGLCSMLASSFVMKIKLQRLFLKDTNSTLEKMGQEETERRTNYDSFINEMIRHVSVVSNPEMAINELLEYIGENLGSDRAYILESNERGTFDNTYEWCRRGIPSRMSMRQNMNHTGAITIWMRQLSQGKNLIVHDIESCRQVNELAYNEMKAQGIRSIICGPIIIDDRMVGFYGVDNPPEETIDRISELLNMMEFAFCMMIRFRESNRKIEENAMHDQLTGCLNRHALSWIYSGSLPVNTPLLVIMCDLNGLKAVNDLQGHGAGDHFIVKTADILKETFGKEHVYRIGGDEFLVLLTGDESKNIDGKIEACKLIIGDTASLGIERRDSLDQSFDEVLKAADMNMYEEKKRYYCHHQDRRKHTDSEN